MFDTKKILRILGCFDRVTELLLLIGSLTLDYINAEDRSVNGLQLLVLPVEIMPFLLGERNATGHVIRYTGISVFALEWISQSLNFSYEVLEDQVSAMEDTSKGKGATSYLKEGKSDLIWGPVAVTSARFSQMDYPYVYAVRPFGILIPMPSSSTDFRSIWKPFQSSVWMYLFISFLSIIAYIWLVHPTKCFLEGNDSLNHRRARMAKYLIVVLMSQGGVYPSKRTSIRILFGTWCLALLVLGKAFSSVLVSIITMPIYQPLINSIYDIPKTSGVHVTVQKDKGMDLYFRESEAGIGKFIGDMLRENPQLRCSKIGDCLERVRTMGSDVHVNGVEILLDLIGRDYQKTNRCDFAIAKEKFASFQASVFAMVKNGPYTKQFNIEFMKAESMGLFQIWWKMTSINPTECVKEHHDRDVDVPTLTLGHLSGAFIILGVGYGIAFICFICKLIYGLY